MDVLEAAAAEIRSKTGGVCEAFRMDIKDAQQVAEAIDAIEKRSAIARSVGLRLFLV